jgi:dUTP pyrophosphatase
MKKVEIKFKKLHPDAVLPKKMSELAGGFDVTVVEIKKEEPDFVICKLGFALQFPADYRLVLVPRSSITKTHWVQQNSPGTGDADYLGEYQYRFRGIPMGVVPDSTALYYEEFPFKVGDRIGQIYLQEIIDMDFILTDELEETVRGEGGFGHTGKN